VPTTGLFTEFALNFDDGKFIGEIPAQPGKRIRILTLGICGDADSQSGPAFYRAQGGSLTVSWSAGQNSTGSPDHFLGVTPVLSGSARGFVYKDVSALNVLTPQIGAALTIQMVGQNDGDGRYCQATDTQGNPYDDPPSSSRGWVFYQYE
jgi:hypothetical protein